MLNPNKDASLEASVSIGTPITRRHHSTSTVCPCGGVGKLLDSVSGAQLLQPRERDRSDAWHLLVLL